MRSAKPPTIVLAALALAVGLLVAGCGGGGGGETSATTTETTETTPALTKQELIARGDAICAEVNTAVGSVGTSAASTQAQIVRVANLYTGMVESIKRLGAPQEAAGYPEFIEAAEALAKVEGEAKLAAEREDTAAIGEAATKAAPVLEEFESVAGEYGFEKCSEGPHAPSASGPGSGVTPSGGGGEESGAEAAPEAEAEAAPEGAAPEEAAPETGGAGGAGEEAAPEGGGAGGGGGASGGSSGGIGPG